MNFGGPSAIGTEMADRFVVSGANLPPVEDRVNEGPVLKKSIDSHIVDNQYKYLLKNVDIYTY